MLPPHTPGFLATGRMRRRKRASTAGMAAVMVEEGVKGLAVHILAVPHVGYRGSLLPALAPRACIKPTVRGMDQLVQTLFMSAP